MDLSLIIDFPTLVKKAKRNSNVRKSTIANEGHSSEHRQSQSSPKIQSFRITAHLNVTI